MLVIGPHWVGAYLRGDASITPYKQPGVENKKVEISYLAIVECWPRAGANPSALGFLRAHLRSVRAQHEPKRP